MRSKPTFPVMYGFFMVDIKNLFNSVSEKGRNLTQNDILRVKDILETTEGFVRALTEKSETYYKRREAIIKKLNQQETLYDQLIVLKEWFGEINMVVDKMYFDIAGIERHDPYSESH